MMLLQLHRAVMDHVSDLFLETSMPLLVLIEAAKAGNEQQVDEFSQLFHDHANKLIEVCCILVSSTVQSDHISSSCHISSSYFSEKIYVK